MSDDVDAKMLIDQAKHHAYYFGRYSEESGSSGMRLGRGELGRLAGLLGRMADALEAVSAGNAVLDTPQGAGSVVGSRQTNGAASQGSRNPQSLFARSVSAGSLAADREAVAKALHRVEHTAHEHELLWRIEAIRAIWLGKADALFASGVVRPVGDAKAEAWDELLDVVDDAAQMFGGQKFVSTSLLFSEAQRLARAAAYRIPASPNEGND